MNDTLGNFSSEVGKAHGGNWLKWLGHLRDRPASGVEIGAWKGESAEWMLDNIFIHPNANYLCVDTFEGSEEHALAGIDCSGLEQETRTRLRRFGKRVVIVKGYSHELLSSDVSFPCTRDFIYVDGAHDAMNVLRDSVLAFELLKVGGVMIWDDYKWTVMPDAIDCPKLAVDSFLACYGRQCEVIGMGWQVAIRKTA